MVAYILCLLPKHEGSSRPKLISKDPNETFLSRPTKIISRRNEVLTATITVNKYSKIDQMSPFNRPTATGGTNQAT